MEEKTIQNNDFDQKIYSDEIKNLIIARLGTIPSNICISIGNEGSFSIKQLIEKIENGDEIGNKIIEMQLIYLRSLKDLPLEIA